MSLADALSTLITRLGLWALTAAGITDEGIPEAVRVVSVPAALALMALVEYLQHRARSARAAVDVAASEAITATAAAQPAPGLAPPPAPVVAAGASLQLLMEETGRAIESTRAGVLAAAGEPATAPFDASNLPEPRARHRAVPDEYPTAQIPYVRTVPTAGETA